MLYCDVGKADEPTIAPKPFLVDNKRLGWQFRDTFIVGVERLQKAGKLKVLDALELRKTLYEIEVLWRLEQHASQRLQKNLRRAITEANSS